eukprot:COSAG06_NODE_11594_length_1487_cov_1.506484_1_plen_122_part_10
MSAVVGRGCGLTPAARMTLAHDSCCCRPSCLALAFPDEPSAQVSGVIGRSPAPAPAATSCGLVTCVIMSVFEGGGFLRRSKKSPAGKALHISADHSESAPVCSEPAREPRESPVPGRCAELA